MKKIVLIAFVLVSLIATISFISPVKAVAEVNILSHTGYIDSLGWYNIVGEVENTGDVAIKFVEIEATYYDVNNTLLATEDSYMTLNTLNPGRKSPFDITLMNEVLAAKVNNYSLTVLSFSVTSSKPIGLEIPSHTSYIDGWGWMTISGDIKNIGTITAAFVKVVATCYDTGGNVVDYGLTYVQPSDIQSNLTIPFEITLYDTERVPYVASYALEAESNEYVLVPEFSTWTSMLPILTVLTVLIAIYKRRLLKTPIH